MPDRIPRYRPPGGVRRFRPPASDRRVESNRFTSSRPWRKLRAAYLTEHPLCADCEHEGRVEAAIEVHHRISRHVRPDLALDWDNLLGLCKPHHSRRTARGE